MTATNPDTFWVEAPCPACGQRSVFGYALRDERGTHQHTRYVCSYWPSGRPNRCGWAGWSVPTPAPGAADPHRLAVLRSYGIEITESFLFQYQHDATVHRLADLAVRLIESRLANVAVVEAVRRPDPTRVVDNSGRRIR